MKKLPIGVQSFDKIRILPPPHPGPPPLGEGVFCFLPRKGGWTFLLLPQRREGVFCSSPARGDGLFCSSPQRGEAGRGAGTMINAKKLINTTKVGQVCIIVSPLGEGA
jgi:hypothetical protein